MALIGRQQSAGLSRLVKFCRVFLASAVMLAPFQTAAQEADPELLRELLNRRGQTQQQQLSPIDRIRSQQDRRDRLEGGRQGLPGQPQQRISEFLRDFRDFSPVEIDYQDRAGQKTQREEFLELIRQTPIDVPQSYDIELRMHQRSLLRQIGYDALDQRDGEEAGITGRIPDDYVLGVGDEIVISLTGSTERTVITRVDREGRVVIESLAPVPAAGRTFAEFRADLERRVSQTLLGTEVFVSVGNLRQITVYVLGQVEYPGSYRVTSLTDVIEALIRAGGIKRTGSLRKVTVRANGRVRTIDLYDILFGEGDANLTLTDGARLTVPLIGPTAAIRGEVVRPGIYELAPAGAEGQTRLDDLFQLAGGGIRPRGYNIFVNRVDTEGRQQITGVNDRAIPLRGGDIVSVQLRRNLTIGEIHVSGRVRVSGRRSLDQAPTLAALLGGGELLQNEAYIPFGILKRTDPESLSKYYVPVNLTQHLTGDGELDLRNRDHFVVLGREEIDFLSSERVRAIILSGQRREQSEVDDIGECAALDVLSQRVRQAELERFSAVLRNIYVGPDIGRREEAVAERQTVSEGGEVITQGEAALAAREEVVTCPEVFDEEPDLLPFVLEYAVSINGAIRQPGLYPLAGKTSLQSLIAAGGGLSNTADRGLIEIQRAAGAESLTLQRRYVDLTKQDAQEVMVLPGSSIRINAKDSRQEPGTVLLTGEFQRPGVYAISRGETLSELIERAGGLTEYAYPYGAVFTRVSVAEEQRKALRRTVRELNNALTLAAMKDNVDGEAVEAARQVSASISTAEVAGRMVIEADPNTLRRQPELDTTLEAGDALYMPKRPSFVLTVGDVLNPSALKFRPGKSVESYIEETGGLLKTADESRVFVVKPNGEARPVTMSLWSRTDLGVEPGSTIIVPKDVEPLASLELVRDLSQILGQLALSAASIAVIFNGN